MTVTATDVNLRKGPGTNYGIVGTANKGDKMVITETASGSVYDWVKAGEKWIALKFTNYAEAVKELEKEEETTVPETTVPETTVPETTVPATTVPDTTAPAVTKVTGTVKANGGLAVRKGPGTGYGVVKYLSNGANVTITEQKKVGTMTWGKVSDGWISMNYVVLDKAQTTTPETTVPETTTPKTEESTLTGKVKVSDALSVRKGAGTSYAVVKYLYNGTKVTITKTQTVRGTKWGYMGSGWICMDYVVLDQQTSVNNGDVKTVTADCQNVRQSASTSAKIVGYYYQGAKVTITETTTAGGTKWGKTTKGWICMDYVK